MSQPCQRHQCLLERVVVDLRSDTVTRPSAEMKKAMFEAPLGDDVLGDDPTVKELEQLAARISGKEAALFVPSGTMANQIAVRLLTQPGDEVLMEEGAHGLNYEAGGAAAIAGVQIRPLPSSGDGILEVPTVAAAIRRQDDHFAPATLLTVEDTSNRGGGSVYPITRLRQLVELAKTHGLKTHMDGARAFNAVAQSGIALDERAEGFDTISFCLSKGLGAPVGSMLCGTKNELITARRIRKMLGGGMRQSGILAAAGIYALHHNTARLADDHRRAEELALGLQNLGFEARLPVTNMVYVELAEAPTVQRALEDRNVYCLAVAPTALRLVTHLDVTDDHIAQAIDAFADLQLTSAQTRHGKAP